MRIKGPYNIMLVLTSQVKTTITAYYIITTTAATMKPTTGTATTTIKTISTHITTTLLPN